MQIPPTPIATLARAILVSIIGLSAIYSTHAQDILENWGLHQDMEEASVFGGLQWVPMGPKFMGSRIETIAVSPDDPATMFVGYGSGGLWKTTDHGLNWKNISKNLASYAMGDLSIAPSNPNILWLGTGEKLRASRGYTYSGSGVYKSEDGGETWVHSGLSDSYQIGKVVIDPYDPNTVFVAVIGHFWAKSKQRGLYLTRDGGTTWDNILYISDSIGITDIVWDANNELLYATSWQMLAGKESKIYKSDNRGTSWKELPLPVHHPETTGRIGLDISKSWPNILYAVVDNRDSESEESSGAIGAEVYKSTDYGESWTKTHTNPIANYAGFGWAFGDIVIHPVHPEEIYLPGIHLLKSTDSGITFQRISGEIQHLVENPSTTLHLDHHEFLILPGKQDKWILGNDGGLYISWNEGVSWLHYNNVPTGEFYDVYTHGNDPVTITGGTQDNSNIIGKINPNDFGDTGSNWNYVWLDPWSGGDGFTCLPDPSDPEWVYWESQNGFLNKKNLRTGENQYIKPSPDEDESPLRNSWFTPYLISNFNHATIYYAANKVYKSINKGENWNRASHDLTFSEDKSKKSRSLTALTVSPVKPGILYAATEKGAVWVTRNDGITWQEISSGIPVKKVVGLLASAHSLSRIYLVAKSMDDNDHTPYLFKSDNFGYEWMDMSSNLPNIPINCITEDPKIENLLIAGTDAGIFISRNGGKKWEAISLHLPTASFNQLRWMSDNQFLLAATHGQGLFYCHFTPIRKFTQSGYVYESQFLSSISGRLPETNDYAGDYKLSSAEPLVISWFSSTEGPAEIAFFDDEKRLASTHITCRKGLNQYLWDLVIEKKPDHTIYPLPEITYPKAGQVQVRIIEQSGVLEGLAEILPARNGY